MKGKHQDIERESKFTLETKSAKFFLCTTEKLLSDRFLRWKMYRLGKLVLVRTHPNA